MLRARHLAVLAGTVSTLAFALPAAAQTADTATPPQDNVSQAGEAAPEEQIIVTGTRRQDRTQAQSPVPVDVIGRDQLIDTGYTEVNRILSQTVPSFNFPQPSATDGTDFVRPATLRGLSPDQTLVLVNGRRRHPSALLNVNGTVGRGSAAVDLNTIPTLAIDRIEVLRDGASSQYGSDAIAGVINIQLRRAPGGRAQVTYGRYITDIAGVSEVTGVSRLANGEPQVDADGNLVLTRGGDRHAEDGDTITYAATYGFALGDRGYLNLTGEYRDRDATNRSGYDPRRQYNLVGGLTDPREFSVDRLNGRFGDAETQDINLFLNSGYELSPSVELYLFGSYSHRDGTGAATFRRPNDVRDRNFSASTTTFVPFYADGFLPYLTSTTEDYAATLGLRGDVSGWHYDLSYGYGRSSFEFGVINSFNASFGANSQTEFDAGGLRYAQNVVNLDIQRNVAPGLSLAFGTEYRDEGFKIVAGDLQSYAAGPFSAAPYNAPAGAQGFPGFRPANEVDVHRQAIAVYGEADADLIPDVLTAQLAGRYEHYTDFGDTLDGKIALRLAPTRWFALRASASTGFRAPSLQQQYYSTTSTNVVNGALLEVLTVPVSNPIARALGSRDLNPERSKNLGAGITLTPARGLSVTVDYYRIDIADRIVLTENLQGAAVAQLLAGAGFPNVTSARFFINGIDTKTEGVDVVGTYRVRDTGFGNFTLTAGYNHNETTITNRAELPTLAGLTLFGRVESLRFERGQPRDKLNLGVDWDLANFGAAVRANRYGEVLSPNSNAAADVLLSPQWVVDAELRVKLFGRFQLAVGANNLLDSYPDALPAGGIYGSTNYFIPFSQFSPAGFNGRFLYGRIAVDF